MTLTAKQYRDVAWSQLLDWLDGDEMQSDLRRIAEMLEGGSPQ